MEYKNENERVVIVKNNRNYYFLLLHIHFFESILTYNHFF